MDVVLTVHDEIVSEAPEGTDLDRFTRLMEQRPAWAEQMQVPVAVEAWSGTRYRK
jgi:DNA polymerase I-like protein with 3'-5' exonuclease and polymerase domains